MNFEQIYQDEIVRRLFESVKQPLSRDAFDDLVRHVQYGATVLDAARPCWAHMVNQQILDVSRIDLCVIAQLDDWIFGDGAPWLEKVMRVLDDPDADLPSEYGLDLPDWAEDAGIPHSVLTAIWQEFINDRKDRCGCEQCEQCGMFVTTTNNVGHDELCPTLSPHEGASA